MDRDEIHVGDLVCKRLQPGTVGRVVEVYHDMVRVTFPMSGGWYEKADVQLKTPLGLEFQLES